MKRRPKGALARAFTFRWAWAAALLAVALLGYASVRSIVMQAVAASPASAAGEAPCADTPMMAMGGKAAAPAGHAAKACVYCAAAGHAPLCASLVAVPGSSVVAWTSYQAITASGPRGPPGFRPKARGPPLHPLTS